MGSNNAVHWATDRPTSTGATAWEWSQLWARIRVDTGAVKMRSSNQLDESSRRTLPRRLPISRIPTCEIRHRPRRLKLLLMSHISLRLVSYNRSS